MIKEIIEEHRGDQVSSHQRPRRRLQPCKFSQELAIRRIARVVLILDDLLERAVIVVVAKRMNE